MLYATDTFDDGPPQLQLCIFFPPWEDALCYWWKVIAEATSGRLVGVFFTIADSMHVMSLVAALFVYLAVVISLPGRDI